jgi:hypothetical protein
MADARFADGEEAPLRLIAREAGDVTVLSALVQDAVMTGADLSYDRRGRRFAVLLNRFRWEDREAAAAARRGVERVKSLLVVEDVLAVRRAGIDPRDREAVLSLLSVGFAAGAEGGGTVTLTLAGDGVVALEVEALELRLEDVTRPWLAPSGRVPGHPD